MPSFIAGISFLRPEQVEIGLINLEGKCEQYHVFPLPSEETLVPELSQMLQSFHEQPTKIGVICHRDESWTCIASPLQEEMNIPVYEGYIGVASALYEHKFGLGKEQKNFVSIALHNHQIEAGIFVNGIIAEGHNKRAGDLGSMLINAYGKMYPLANYLSYQGVVDSTTRLMANGYIPSPLRNIAYNQLQLSDIIEAAIEKDDLALNAMTETGKLLGLKLSDITNYFSPKKYIISSNSHTFSRLIRKSAAKNMEKNLFPVFKGKISVEISELKGKVANVVRASALAN